MVAIHALTFAFLASSVLAAPPTDLKTRDFPVELEVAQNEERSVCTGFNIGKFGWCGGCKRLETCSAYLAFLSGCTSVSVVGVLGCAGAVGFLGANADYCLEGLCVCQGNHCKT